MIFRVLMELVIFVVLVVTCVVSVYRVHHSYLEALIATIGIFSFIAVCETVWAAFFRDRS